MDRLRTVYASGSGTVIWVFGPNPPDIDSKIGVKMTNTFSYYLNHIVLNPGITVGSSIKAG